MTPTAAFFAFIVVLFTKVPAKAQGAYNVLPGEESVALMQSESGKASKAASKAITVSIKDLPLAEALDYIARQAQMRVAYAKDIPGLSDKLSLELKNVRLREVLNKALSGKHLTAVFASDGETIVIQRDTGSTVNTTGGAQDRKVVSGRVVDSASKEGLQGVAVVLKGSNLHAVTDKKGNFVLMGVSSDPSQIITFKLLGYRSQSRSFEIGDGKQIKLDDVSLAQSASVMSEVVTTATGRQRRVEVPSDIVKIDADEIKERTPVRTVTDMLEAAQVPGVLVQRGGGEPGAPTRIRMRGIGSISQTNDPVIIVDGIWINNKSDNQGSRGIDAVDPETIETIEIIRGPSAATMYGMDAANGVIVITTKKGQAGNTRWNLGYSYDWGSIQGKKPLRYIGVGHISDMAFPSPVYCPALAVTNNEGRSVAQGTCVQDSVLVYDPNNDLVNNEGVESNHRLNLSVDGGSEAVRYAIAFSTQDQLGARRQAPVDLIRMRKLGIVPEKDFLQPSFLDDRNITMNFSLNPRRDLDVLIALSGAQRGLRDNRYDFSFQVPDLTDVKNLSLDTVLFIENSTLNQSNSLMPRSNNSKISTIRLSSTSSWMPRSGTTFRGIIGIDRNINESSQYRYSIRCAKLACSDTNGVRREDRRELDSYSVRLSGSTIIDLGGFNRFLELRPSVGGDYRKNNNSSLYLEKRGLPPGESSLGTSAQGVQTIGAYNNFANASAGWYVNTTIQVFRRLYFDIGVRQDIGSAITSTSSSGGFPFGLPKLGSSWLLSDEAFWPSNSIISLFRLRGAIGYAAVQPEITDIRGRYMSGSAYADSGRFFRSVVLSGAPNSTLVPEKSGEIEVGFDADMFHEKLFLVVTYAHKQNKNTIITRPIAPSAGLAGGRKENIARVMNRNFELSGTGRMIENKRILLIGNYALTLSENKVAKLGNNISQASDGGRIVEGYPLAGQWSRVVLGFRDINEDGVLSPDEIVLSDDAVYRGWSQPRHRSSFGLSLTLNNQFTLDSRFAYQSSYAQSYRLEGLQGREDASTPFIVQAMYSARAGNGNSGMNGTRSVSDFRWNSASLTYHVPQHLVSRLSSRALQVSLQANNLALWTNYVGRDPSINSELLKDSPLEISSDDGAALPRPRLFVLRFQWGI